MKEFKITDLKSLSIYKERFIKLGKVNSGTGHDNFLKGITVSFVINAPQYWWMQAERYTFLNIVSSQSKMHCLTKFDIINQCNKYVDDRIIHILNELKTKYLHESTQENFQKFVSNVPMGFMLAAGMSTNYLQLKTIIRQRKNHKLEEWKYFCGVMLANCEGLKDII